jgi:hypothetical protein
MKYLIFALLFACSSCSHAKLTHKCNGDKICRCVICDKAPCADCICK